MVAIRWIAVLPVVLALPAFILSMLCIFAGSQKGFMEDYHIILLNSSTIGETLLLDNSSTPTFTVTAPTSTATGILSGLTGTIDNITNTIEGDVDGLLEDLANELALAMGIEQWYSLHLMDMCYGLYSPNATASGASLNISDCTAPVAMYHFDPTSTIDDQLMNGPLGINISSIGWPQDIQNGINELNELVDAVFVLYCLGAAFAGLAMITAAAALFMAYSRLFTLANWGVSLVAWLALGVASILVTMLAEKIVAKMNQYSGTIGVYAHKGSKFLSLSWAAFALMLLANVAWFADCYLATRRRKQEFREKGGQTKTGRKTGLFGRKRKASAGDSSSADNVI